jgi:primosomal protein N'
MRVKEYEDAIRSVVARRRTVLLLSPFQERAEEWAQLLEERGMGSSMIFTSKLPMRERKDCFRRCLGGENGIVIGTRSALFLPFQRLGLVIVDDEHHPFYKSDRTPRYHAREIARVIAEESGATLILGSCSPSVESWGAFRRGECVLKMRASSGNLRASLIDLQDTPCSPFPLSAPLLSLLAKEVSEGRRVMVFLNDRRRLSDAASLLKRRFGEEALIFRTLPSLPLSTLSDVVVALDADVLRNIPNFRAAEWTFQQLMHCRALAREHLIIQTRRPEAPEIRAAVSGDVTSFLDAELSERRRAGYPPFQPMTRLVIKGEDGGRRARCLVSALKEEGVHASCLPAREGNAWQVFFRGKEPRSVLAKLDVRGVSIDREPQEW